MTPTEYRGCEAWAMLVAVVLQSWLCARQEKMGEDIPTAWGVASLAFGVVVCLIFVLWIFA
jgi:hypothetical protein